MSYATNLQAIIDNNTAKLASLSALDTLTVTEGNKTLDVNEYRRVLREEIKWAQEQLAMNPAAPVESVHQVR